MASSSGTPRKNAKGTGGPGRKSPVKASQSAPAKKRSPRKKKKKSSGPGLALAFAGGALLACLLFALYLNGWLPGLSEPAGRAGDSGTAASGPEARAKPLPAKQATAKATGGKNAQATSPATGPKNSQAAGPASSPKQDQPSGVKSGRAGKGAASGPGADKQEQPSPPSGRSPSPSAAGPGQRTDPLPEVSPSAPGQTRAAYRIDPQSRSAVDSALSDLQRFAYEDVSRQSLEDRVLQVDYAVMQAAWMQKLPAGALRLGKTEDRENSGQKYRFQQVDILPGASAGPFLEALRDSLALWGEGAALREAGKNAWKITLDGVQTHMVRLYPGASSFPPDPAATPLAVPTEKSLPIPGMAKPRLRASTEEPRLVIVIDDLGADPAALRALLALDYPVSFAFWPHGRHTRLGAEAAHARGMEILIHQPMEPLGYPRVKPGPDALLASMGEAQIRRILAGSIAAVPHAVGLNNHMGSRFTQHAAGVDAVIRLLRERGLFMLDSLTHSGSVFARQGKKLGIEHYSRNVFLDVTHTRQAVLEALRRAERIALLTGQAVAIGHPLPETLAGLKDWQRLRNKEVRIVRLRDLTR